MPQGSRPSLRLIVDPAGPGAWNMAIDEVLLQGPGDRWTLRFYRWLRPTLSLGYAQPIDGGVDEAAAARLSIPIVRRPTGGRAVLHADELTYALAGPVEPGPLAGGVSASYRRIAAGLQDGLARIGIETSVERSGPAPRPTAKGPCFSARTRYELSVDGRKLVGSAQRRAGGRLLQHGSILIGRPEVRLWAALGAGSAEAAAASVGLAEVLGRRPSLRATAMYLAEALARELDLEPRCGALDVAEIRRARLLQARYAGSAWTRRR